MPNRNSPPAILLRESYRVDGNVKTRTLQNLTRWPETKIQALERVLRDEPLVGAPGEITLERSLPHGHVAAVLHTIRSIRLDKLLPKASPRAAKLMLALVAGRVVAAQPKLATARALSATTAAHSLGAVFGLGEVDEDELYDAMDRLGGAQEAIERCLAKKHLCDGSLVLYDLTSRILKGAVASWVSLATAGISAAIGCRSFLASCARRMDARLRSKFSTAMSQTPQRWRRRSQKLKNKKQEAIWS